MFMMMIVGIILNILTFGASFVIVPAMAVGLCLSLDGLGTKTAAGLGAACILGCATAHSYTYMARPGELSILWELSSLKTGNAFDDDGSLLANVSCIDCGALHCLFDVSPKRRAW